MKTSALKCLFAKEFGEGADVQQRRKNAKASRKSAPEP